MPCAPCPARHALRELGKYLSTSSIPNTYFSVYLLSHSLNICCVQTWARSRLAVAVRLRLLGFWRCDFFFISNFFFQGAMYHHLLPPTGDLSRLIIFNNLSSLDKKNLFFYSTLSRSLNICYKPGLAQGSQKNDN